MAGVSRSPTIVTAYLMKKFDVPYEAALQFVQKKHPNPGFKKQLLEYEKTLTLSEK